MPRKVPCPEPTTAELDAFILQYLDWRERDWFERAGLATNPKVAAIERAFGESESGGGIPERGAGFASVLACVKHYWPDVHRNAVDAALRRLEAAGLVRPDQGKAVGTTITIWRTNVDGETRALLYRLHAAAPNSLRLSDDELDELDRYLSTRDRPGVTLPVVQGKRAPADTIYQDELDGEQRQLAHLRSVLEHNRKLRSNGAPGQEAATTPKRKRRGRKPNTDPKADKQVADAWNSGGYADYAHLGRDIGMSKDDVRRALDRDRHRNRK
jgi:hypothetical protein